MNSPTEKQRPPHHDLPREYIIKKASKLFIKNSYDRTSIRDIASACDMAMGTLYHYIGSKENLLRLVVETHSEKTREVVAKLQQAKNRGTPSDALVDSINFFIQAIEKNKEIFVFIFTEAKVMPLHNRRVLLDTQREIVHAFGQILLKGQQNGVFLTQDTNLAAHTLVSLVEMWGVKWWYLREHYTLNQYRDFITGFMLNSICY